MVSAYIDRSLLADLADIVAVLGIASSIAGTGVRLAIGASVVRA